MLCVGNLAYEPQVQGFTSNVDAATQRELDDAVTALTAVGATKAQALTPTAVKTGNYTAAAGDFVPVDTTSGSVTITLPTAPADGSRVGIKHVIQGGTNTVTFACGGSDVFNKAGGSTSGTLTLLAQAVSLQYKASGAIWYVVADDLPLSQLDGRYARVATTGTLAARPTPTVVNQRYLATDVAGGTEYESFNGTTWTQTTPGVNVSGSTASLSYSAMETSLLAKLLNNVHAASGNMAFEWISPGASYLSGQWVWDSCFEAVVAASLGQGTRAQNWLKNWVGIQDGTGFLPTSAAPSTTDTKASQPPLLAWACLQVYNHTNDSAFLTFMYSCLKNFYAWWETNRKDANNLFSWGTNQSGAATNVKESDARHESGQDGNVICVDGCFGHVNGTTVDHICPDLCSFLVNEADSIASIATILGNSSDATTYAAKRDALKTAMNNILWDDDQGCYQFVARADLGTSLGNTGGSTTAAGATSVTLASALTIPLVQGQRLLFANGVTAQVGPAGAAVGATSVPLQIALSGSVPASNAVTMLRVLYCKTLASVALPLFAKVPTQAQAKRIHDEHLMKVWSGTEVDSFVLYLGSGHQDNRLLKFRHLAWRQAALAAVSGQLIVNADSLEQITGAGTLLMLAMQARNTANTADRPMADLRWDEAKCSPSRPVTITVTWVQPASGNNKPQVTLASLNGPASASASTTQLNVVLSSAASVGAVTSASTATTGSYHPYIFQLLQQSGNNANLKVQSIQIDSYPVGGHFLTPYGLCYQGRFSDYAVAPTEDDGTTADYWRGDMWVNLEYLTVLGLLNYNMGQSARLIADLVVKRVHGEWARTGNIWERYSMRGAGKSSIDYGWTALASVLVRLFKLPSGDAALTP